MPLFPVNCGGDDVSMLIGVHGLQCRAKFGESAFLDVYQKLYEAPDPAPSLGTALVSPQPLFCCKGYLIAQSYLLSHCTLSPQFALRS